MEAIILAAGKGTRMRSGLPKVLHRALGRPILGHVLTTLAALHIQRPYVVLGSGGREVSSFLKEIRLRLGLLPKLILQKVQRGTGHAVMMAEKSLARSSGPVLIWPGDMPLVKRTTLAAFIRAHRESRSEASVLSSWQENPAGYGRILREGGEFNAIREELDASPEERKVQEINTGIYLFRRRRLFEALAGLRPANQKKELYLTDTIEILSTQGAPVHAFRLASSEEGSGVNDRADLGRVTHIMGMREIKQHMEQGVTFVLPEQTYVERDVQIGKDTIIYPWSYIESGVKIGSRCEIGPYAKIRSGTVVDDESVVGSFVEVVRSKLGKRVLVKHLAYLGDAVIRDKTNIGAGCITANFDGKRKHRTTIGKHSLIGSNTVFVAPVTLGDEVRTGAGSVLTKGSKIKKGDIVAGIPARSIKSKKKLK